MEKKDHIILVTGASGTQGEAVALELLRSGFKVRGLVHNSEPQKLKEAGAEIVRGNFDDLESLTKAMEGVYGVFSMQNVDMAGGDAERRHAKNIANAALKAGVKQIVHTSVNQEGHHEKFSGWQEGRWTKARDYWIEKQAATQAIVESGVEYWTILKPVFLMDNFIPPKVGYMFPHLKQGEILTAFHPDTKLQLIAADDVGKFATAAFKDPKSYHQKRIDLASEALNMTEIADRLSAIVGKRIQATHVTPEEAVAKGLFELWVSSQQWDNEIGYNADIEALKQYGGPLTLFEEWAKKHKDEFLIEN